ncbi:unnamed protein product [Rangifer tarandus platyrhynchus]|uniref:Uncharacterized protein n=2 Tax=Rangifer tarandus platyrhynchus TaxID=3082113 RepID=A0AC60A226_RANTA|nr:unnamed protein product [Rangifer tarandus platyrhynchus]
MLKSVPLTSVYHPFQPFCCLPPTTPAFCCLFYLSLPNLLLSFTSVPFASLLSVPGTCRQLASPSISALKQPGPCSSISVPVGALGVSPSALFSAELGRSPLRLHRAQLRVLLCLEVTSVDPFPSLSPHHTHSGLGAVVPKSFPPYFPPCLLSLC